MKKNKKVSESITIMTEMIFPNDTNTLGNLMGGNLMRMMDIVAAITAQKHANSLVVTASVDSVSFKESIPLGNVVTLQAKITRAFNTSMEIVIDVWSDDIPAQKRISSNKAFFTFVAVDKEGKPVSVPEVVPETTEEKELYNKALERRQLRLLLSGRITLEDATELKAYFKI